MKIYRVGGAVRDRLLGRQSVEQDWVVVGATPAQMENAGYRKVGKAFPVYIHPKTKEEYALARTERKVSSGYHGFEFRSDAGVTLEEDLQRRDLTINAIAEDSSGKLIDPYGGIADLNRRVLRHVSPAFREDPVRVLRLARFAARFAPLGFTVSSETMSLVREMVGSGEVDALVPERIFKEMNTAFSEARPDVFIRVLKDCDALERVFPEVDRLFGIPQSAKYHPEVDTGEHLLLALRQAAQLGAAPEEVFAVLTHDLGKGLTPRSQWPLHVGHEKLGISVTRRMSDRLACPRVWRELATIVTGEHQNVHSSMDMPPDDLLGLFSRTDAFRRPGRFKSILLACEADARGRRGYADTPYPQREHLLQLLEVASGVRVVAKDLTGEAVGRRLWRRRKQAIAAELKVLGCRRDTPE